VDDEEAAALMIGLSTSKVSNTEDSRRAPKKRVSGKRTPKAVAKAVTSDVGVGTTSDTPMKPSVKENPTKKVKIEHKEEPKGKGKGKEPIGDSDDEGDDAVPAQAVEDDDDPHTKMMTHGRRVKLVPRDHSHAPLSICDYDMRGVGIGPLEDEKTANQAEWASKGYEVCYLPDGDILGPCNEEENVPEIQECLDYIDGCMPSTNDRLRENLRQSQLIEWERTLDNLRVDVSNTEDFGREEELERIAEKFQELKKMLQEFSKGRIL